METNNMQKYTHQHKNGTNMWEERPMNEFCAKQIFIPLWKDENGVFIVQGGGLLNSGKVNYVSKLVLEDEEK
jgi:hypothetical protein